MHVIIWKFRAQPGQEAAFERRYGADGDWVRLFRRFPGYVGTELLRCEDGEYLTVDRWDTREAYDTFHRDGGEEYRRLDASCERLTASEVRIGRCEAV